MSYVIVFFGFLFIVTIAIFVTYWNTPIIDDTNEQKENNDETL